MGISHQKKFIYFVAPKCGSATVRNTIDKYRDIKKIPEFFSEHITVRQLMESEFSSFANKYFKFTFVRNPYDRIYSGFLQDIYASNNFLRWKKAKRKIFKEIGNDFNRYVQIFVSRGDLENDWRWICFKSLKEFSHYNGKYYLDWHGKLENLNQDLFYLSRRLDLGIGLVENKNVRTLPTMNLKYTDQYERKTIEIVNELYSFDFEFFGYKKLNPSDFPLKV